MKTVIGIAGRANAGKSTCAEFLMREYGAKRISFADPVKDMAVRILGFTQEQVRGTQAQKETIDPRYGFSPRDAMILIGDGGRKVLGEDVWLRAALLRIEVAPPGIYVVDDVRYPNEAAMLARGTHTWLAHVIRISRPDRLSNIPTECSVDEICASDLFADISVPTSPRANLLIKVFSETVANILPMSELPRTE